MLGRKPTVRTIYSLQAGRGLAALSVVLLHANLASEAFADLGFIPFRYGYLGVDFFFVLSGFIIFHSTVGEKELSDYAWSRFRRIYLPYWPIGLGIALLYTALPALRGADHLPWSWFPTLTLAPVDSRTALAVAWTLKHEILFYVAFGLFYYSGLLWLGLAIWGLCIALGLPHLPFEPINLEFFFGIGAALLYRTRSAHPVLMIFGAGAILVWVALGATETLRAVFGLGLSFIIAPIAQLERDHFSVPHSLVLLGAASYSLYLIHDPLISVVARVVPAVLILPVSTVVALAGGFAYHFLIEKPMCTLKLRWGRSSSMSPGCPPLRRPSQYSRSQQGQN